MINVIKHCVLNNVWRGRDYQLLLINHVSWTEYPIKVMNPYALIEHHIACMSNKQSGSRTFRRTSLPSPHLTVDATILWAVDKIVPSTGHTQKCELI